MNMLAGLMDANKINDYEVKFYQNNKIKIANLNRFVYFFS